jgi:hypothetical protein
MMAKSSQETTQSNPKPFLQITTPKNKFQNQNQSYHYTTQQIQSNLLAIIQLY